VPSPEPVTLTLWDEHGNSESVILAGPGGTIRVVVGEPGRQSGVWRIWAPPTKFDVYVGIRAILGYQKWSLHETGDWRFQWISDERAAEFGNTDSRIIDQWQRPEEIPETGWIKGFSIRVRHQDLVEVADPEKVPADAVWIPSPPEGHSVGLHVVIARPDRGEIALTGSIPLGGVTLVDGRALLLVVSVDRVTDEHDQMIETALTEAMRLAREQGVDLAAAVNPRAALSGNNAQGDRFVWDVAVPAPQAPREE
jgi:hypothetical protein